MIRKVRPLLLFTLASTIIGCGPRHRADIPALQKKYMAQEGHQNRGVVFAELASAMDSPLVAHGTPSHQRWNLQQILAHLGPPDYQRTINKRTEMVYLWDRFGKKDWFVMVLIPKSGTPADFGYNAVSALDLSQFDEGAKSELTEQDHEQ